MAVPRFQDHAAHARGVIDAVLKAADPGAALERHWVDPSAGPVMVLAFGKASVKMAGAALSHLADREVVGIVTAVPEQVGTVELDGQVAVYPVDHPLPSQRNVEAARMVASLTAMFAETHGDAGTLVALISGGGSAHLTLPAGRLSLEDLRTVNGALQRAGAPIQDLNAVRKHTEVLKGGRLAALAEPARVVSYIVSDVLGDRLDVIASGPLAPDPTTYANALGVLERFGVGDAAPAVTEHLRRGGAGELPETPKPGDPVFAAVTSTIVANNEVAVGAAAKAVTGLGLQVAGVRTGVDGDASAAGEMLARRGAELAAAAVGSAFVIGGETTVRVGEAGGKGGPSQEMALSAAVELERLDAGAPGLGLRERAVVLTFSTDGVDGPTDAAGAVVTVETSRGLRGLGIDPAAALGNHDSYTALDRVGALIRTGPTGTNVNHVAVVLVHPSAEGAATRGVRAMR